MSVHRYPCNVEAPQALGIDGHRHACIHDAEPKPNHDTGRLIEHKCECGTMWTMPEWQPRPVPDTSWINTSAPERDPWWRRVLRRRVFRSKWHPFGPI